MKKFDCFSTVSDNGEIQKGVEAALKDWLLSCIGKRIRITLGIVRNERSNAQNRYYWGVVVEEQRACFLERWGEIWDRDEVHDWNKCNIWHTEIIDTESGEIIKKPGSSKTKTTIEFEERLEKLRQKFHLDFEWQIPLPNETLNC